MLWFPLVVVRAVPSFGEIPIKQHFPWQEVEPKSKITVSGDMGARVSAKTLSNSDYRPIPCAVYDLYEIALMRGQRLRVRWSSRVPWYGAHGHGQLNGDEDSMRAFDQVIEPVGLVIRDGAEWLSARDEAGGACDLRLDWIADLELVS